MSKTAYKWLPVIETDTCVGCGLCLKACEPHNALEFVWDFATVKRPEDCSSCGECVRVCPQEGIRMDWVPATGSPVVGQWRDEPPPLVAAKSKHWLWGLFDKQQS